MADKNIGCIIPCLFDYGFPQKLSLVVFMEKIE